MEALIFFFDVGCITYLCWCVYRLDSKRPGERALGIFSYRSTETRDAAGGTEKAAEKRRA